VAEYNFRKKGRAQRALKWSQKPHMLVLTARQNTIFPTIGDRIRDKNNYYIRGGLERRGGQ
jgi:hypothetical protein